MQSRFLSSGICFLVVFLYLASCRTPPRNQLESQTKTSNEEKITCLPSNHNVLQLVDIEHADGLVVYPHEAELNYRRDPRVLAAFDFDATLTQTHHSDPPKEWNGGIRIRLLKRLNRLNQEQLQKYGIKKSDLNINLESKLDYSKFAKYFEQAPIEDLVDIFKPQMKAQSVDTLIHHLMKDDYVMIATANPRYHKIKFFLRATIYDRLRVFFPKKSSSEIEQMTRYFQNKITHVGSVPDPKVLRSGNSSFLKLEHNHRKNAHIAPIHLYFSKKFGPIDAVILHDDNHANVNRFNKNYMKHLTLYHPNLGGYEVISVNHSTMRMSPSTGIVNKVYPGKKLPDVEKQIPGSKQADTHFKQSRNPELVNPSKRAFDGKVNNKLILQTKTKGVAKGAIITSATLGAAVTAAVIVELKRSGKLDLTQKDSVCITK